MPRKSIADIHAEEATAPNSPLRRSTRLRSTTTSSPAPTAVVARRSSATEEATPKATRTRRASIAAEADSIKEVEVAKKTAKAAPATPGRRGRKPSTASAIVEEVEPAASTAPISAATPKKATTVRRTSQAIDVEPVKKPTVRGRKASTSEEKPLLDEEPKKTIRNTRKSLAAAEPKKPTIRRKSAEKSNAEDEPEKKARKTTVLGSKAKSAVAAVVEHVDTPIKKSPLYSPNYQLEQISEIESPKGKSQLKNGKLDFNDSTEKLEENKIDEKDEIEKVENDEGPKMVKHLEKVTEADDHLDKVVRKNDEAEVAIKSKVEETKIEQQTEKIAEKSEDNNTKAETKVSERPEKAPDADQVQPEIVDTPKSVSESPNLDSSIIDDDVFKKSKDVTLNKSTEQVIESIEKLVTEEENSGDIKTKAVLVERKSINSFGSNVTEESFHLELSESIFDATVLESNKTQTVFDKVEAMEVDVSVVMETIVDSKPPSVPIEDIEKKLKNVEKINEELVEFLEKEIRENPPNAEEQKVKIDQSLNESSSMESFNLSTKEVDEKVNKAKSEEIKSSIEEKKVELIEEDEIKVSKKAIESEEIASPEISSPEIEPLSDVSANNTINMNSSKANEETVLLNDSLVKEITTCEQSTKISVLDTSESKRKSLEPLSSPSKRQKTVENKEFEEEPMQIENVLSKTDKVIQKTDKSEIPTKCDDLKKDLVTIPKIIVEKVENLDCSLIQNSQNDSQSSDFETVSEHSMPEVVEEESSDSEDENEEIYKKFVKSSVKIEEIFEDEKLDETYEPSESVLEAEDIDIPEEEDIIEPDEITEQNAVSDIDECFTKPDGTQVFKKTRSVAKLAIKLSNETETDTMEAKKTNSVKITEVINEKLDEKYITSKKEECAKIVEKTTEETDVLKKELGESTLEKLSEIVETAAVNTDEINSTRSTSVLETEEVSKVNEEETKSNANLEDTISKINEEASSESEESNDEESAEKEEYKEFLEVTLKNKPIEAPEDDHEMLDSSYKPSESVVEDVSDEEEENLEDESVLRDEISLIEANEPEELIKPDGTKVLKKTRSVSSLLKNEELSENKEHPKNKELSENNELPEEKFLEKNKTVESVASDIVEDTTSDEDSSEDEEVYKKFIEKSIRNEEIVDDADLDESFVPSDAAQEEDDIEIPEEDEKLDEDEKIDLLEEICELKTEPLKDLEAKENEAPTEEESSESESEDENADVSTKEEEEEYKKFLAAQELDDDEAKDTTYDPSDSLMEDMEAEEESFVISWSECSNVESDASFAKPNAVKVYTKTRSVSRMSSVTSDDNQVMPKTRVSRLVEESVINLVTSEDETPGKDTEKVVKTEEAPISEINEKEAIADGKGSKRRRLYRPSSVNLPGVFSVPTSSDSQPSSMEEEEEIVKEEEKSDEAHLIRNGKNAKHDEKENLKEKKIITEVKSVLRHIKVEEITTPIKPSTKDVQKQVKGGLAWQVQEAEVIKPSTRNVTPMKPNEK